METQLAERKERVLIQVEQKIRDVIDAAANEICGRDIDALTKVTNRQIEKGLETIEDAKAAEATRKDGSDVLKAADAIRLEFTGPAETFKKNMIANVRKMMQQLGDANTKLFGMLKAKEQKRRDDEAAAQAEHDRKVREAAEAAAKKTEQNKAISVGMVGGDAGHIKEVEPEPVEPRIAFPKPKVTTARSLPDHDKIKAAIDSGLHEIPGIKIEQVWIYKIEESKLVPEKYRSLK